ncbi:hypothetical protein GCM10025864_06500 [Luteimicrobium album]|uniref:Gfo/Idh/MocA-like oxidoreductase N-terminal domain-containing protein n=1 Tax=Luteimicrobium album TaxID=1054550 RepID=A0ABQ6HXY8_9MICO|nr:Gfo/Idh/MocA family oxidoreductase [Luteimicrobium album]GMA22891.1 hypothetical protein GCM10025864_06500 [Luteimicrobium album]
MNGTRIVVLGTGRWGHVWLDVLDGRTDVEIVGAAGRTGAPEHVGRADGYVECPDYEDLLDRVDADAAVVALPAALHAEAVRRCLARGLHVLCEKPATTSIDDLRSLLDASAGRPDRVVVVDQNYRSRPWAARVRRAVLAHVPEPVHVSVRFRRPAFLEPGVAKMPRPLLDDMAVHHLDLVRFVLGTDLVRVAGRLGRAATSPYPGAPDLDALLETSTGIPVLYEGSWDCDATVTGWEGEWEVRDRVRVLRATAGELTLTTRSGTEVLWQEETPADDDAHDDLTRVLDTFLSAVRGGAEPPTSLRRNANTAAAVLALARSVETGAPVHVRDGR